MELNDFESRLKWVLLRRKLTQTDLAKMLNISPGRLNNYLSGRNVPNMHMLIDIAKALNTTIDFLAGNTNNSAPLVEFIFPPNYLEYSVSSSDNEKTDVITNALPLYNSEEINSDAAPWKANPERLLNLSLLSEERLRFENSYALYVSNSNLAPFVGKGDLLVVWGAELMPESINYSKRDIYTFKRSAADQVGLAVGFASYSNGIIFAGSNLEGSDNGRAFDVSRGGFSPICGRVISLLRVYSG
jgi:transcriptional regulator with XRE-family HTH domain